MADFNKVILIGRLTKDLELKVTQSGIPVVSGSIAVNRPYKQDKERKADFFNFTAWRGTAEFIARYFHQGSNILIEGALQTRDYTANDGSKRYVTEVVVANAGFIDKAADAPQDASQADYMPQGGVPYPGAENAPQGLKYTQAPMTVQTPPEANWTEVGDEDDLPF